MSVTVRPFRTGGWEVDIHVIFPDGKKRRSRTRKRMSKSAALRWGETRERALLVSGSPRKTEEVPRLEEFKNRFLDGYARANRQKPSGISSKESILRVHLVRALGSRRLDQITNEDVQRLKHRLRTRSPKTVNNVLTVLNTLLKTAVEWGVIDTMPCTIKLLRVPRGAVAFHDFDDYTRLVEAAAAVDHNAELIVLLGGEAGLRCGEMMALEWRDVDLDRGQLTVRQSEWKGHVTATEGWTHPPCAAHRQAEGCAATAQAPARSASAGRAQDRGYIHPEDGPRPCAVGCSTGEAGTRGCAHSPAHVLFSSSDAGSQPSGDSGTRGTSGSVYDATLHAPESSGHPGGHRPPESAYAWIRQWRDSGVARDSNP